MGQLYDTARNAAAWARLFIVIGAHVLINGIPDTEYTGHDTND